MAAVEPILQDNKNRFVIFPIEHHDIGSGTKNKKRVFGLQKRLTCIRIWQIGKISLMMMSVILSSIS